MTEWPFTHCAGRIEALRRWIFSGNTGAERYRQATRDSVAVATS